MPRSVEFGRPSPPVCTDTVRTWSEDVPVVWAKSVVQPPPAPTVVCTTPVSRELEELGLSHYRSAFDAAGVRTLPQLLRLSEDDLYSIFGARKVGPVRLVLHRCQALRGLGGPPAQPQPVWFPTATGSLSPPPHSDQSDSEDIARWVHWGSPSARGCRDKQECVDTQSVPPTRRVGERVWIVNVSVGVVGSGRPLLGVDIDDVTLRVVKVHPDSPAADAGVRRGMRLLKVGATAVTTPSDVVDAVKRCEGVSVEVVVSMRAGRNGPVRDPVQRCRPERERPSWRPDDEATHCLSCSKLFDSHRRRHHCRYCGEIYCGPCAQRMYALPRLGYARPVRVCNGCSDLIVLRQAAGEEA
eukprot:TRINITY_DN27926_c0_g1_i1.p1 TRINITY_DN27926_c0_g1~~TRINITY_DN27926_c0_g1_i1.p1  ORF type:complete len:355 (+),score=62.65 TRINITY_DN27926_c0_g1_i1:97-1161(+)